MLLNLNRANLSIEPINVAINDAIERAAATSGRAPASVSRREHCRTRVPAQRPV